MPAAEMRAAIENDGAEKPHAKVEIPRWGVVYVRDISGDEFDRYTREAKEAFGDLAELHQLAFGAAIVLCDENGERLYDPMNPAHLALLGGKRKRDLEKVVSAGAETGN